MQKNMDLNVKLVWDKSAFDVALWSVNDISGVYNTEQKNTGLSLACWLLMPMVWEGQQKTWVHNNGIWLFLETLHGRKKAWPYRRNWVYVIHCNFMSLLRFSGNKSWCIWFLWGKFTCHDAFQIILGFNCPSSDSQWMQVKAPGHFIPSLAHFTFYWQHSFSIPKWTPFLIFINPWLWSLHRLADPQSKNIRCQGPRA